MPGDEDIQWVKATANELNNLLQVISESSQVLETICAESPDTEKYFAILRSGVERATRVTRMMVDRVGGYYVEAGPTTRAEVPAPTILPPLPQASADVRIFNPTGSRELVMIVDDEDLVTMLARGLRGFIPKPYTQQKLLAQIRSVLDTLNSERSGERRVM